MATLVVPSPTIPEDEAVNPSAVSAKLVDSGSVETPDSFVWAGAEEGEDYSFGHDDVDGPAASDATLVSSAPVTLNASVSSYTAPRRTAVRSQPPACVLKLPKAWL